MKIPSFRYMGGKARLRKWLIEHFPKKGRTYLEPFAGRGNVFYLACQKLDFQNWQLGDIDISFFCSLLTSDLDQLPEIVSKDDFRKWRDLRREKK